MLISFINNLPSRQFHRNLVKNGIQVLWPPLNPPPRQEELHCLRDFSPPCLVLIRNLEAKSGRRVNQGHPPHQPGSLYQPCQPQTVHWGGSWRTWQHGTRREYLPGWSITSWIKSVPSTIESITTANAKLKSQTHYFSFPGFSGSKINL